MFFQKFVWMVYVWICGFVVVLFDLVVFGCFWVVGVVYVGRVVLVVQQWEVDFFVGVFEFVIGIEEGQWVVDWYDGQVFVDYFGDQVVLEVGVDDDVIGYDCVVMCDDVFDMVVFDDQ